MSHFRWRDIPTLGVGGLTNDNMESYASLAFLNTLNGGTKWGGTWVDRTAPYGIMDYENFEDYADAAAVDGLNSRMTGFPSAWVDRVGPYGIKDNDNMETYADAAAVDALNGGTIGWSGAWVDRSLSLTSPTQLSNFGTWWKVDSITGLSDGAAISTWNDSQGSTTLTATTTTRPLYKTNIFGSQPAVRFDGTDDFFTCSSVTLNITTKWTVFVVMKYGASASGTGMLFGQNGTNNQFGFDTSNTISFYNSGAGSGNGSAAYSTALTSARLAVIRYGVLYGANRLNFLENGGTDRDGSNNWAISNFTFDRVGRWNSAANPLNADIAEILIYNDEKTYTEIRALYLGYFKPKYSTLP